MKQCSFDVFLDIIKKQMPVKNDWPEETIIEFHKLYENKKKEGADLQKWAALIGRTIYAQDLECEW